jgi:hypothetical protein
VVLVREADGKPTEIELAQTFERMDQAFSRPLCPYPSYPQYIGRGDMNSANSYACRPGSRDRFDER